MVFSYPEQRTIVRQGERTTCFYIILSGSAIPTYRRVTDGSIETLDVLKRGSTFGVRYSIWLKSIVVVFFSIEGKRFNDGFYTEFYCDVKNQTWIISLMERCKY